MPRSHEPHGPQDVRDDNGDALLAHLAGLAVEPPAGLLDRIAARWARVPGPVGGLSVVFTDHGIAYVRPATVDLADSFREQFGRPLLPADRPPPGLIPALRSGRAAGLRFDLRSLTEFQQDVLRVTQTIPKGELRPYAWIAQQIGRPQAVRAVGSALGRNPVPVLIPCHRVTRSDGSLGGYVFGPDFKEELLRSEAVDLDEVRELAAKDVLYLGSDTTQIVCFPTCHNARRITPSHRRGFRSLDEAVAAGYQPCQTCRPAGGMSLR